MKWMKKAAVLAAVAALATMTAFAASVPSNVLRVGIKYGSATVGAYNMLTDNGYEIGYYDGNNIFHVEARLSSRFISVARDVSLKISGSSVTPAADGATVKPYHLQVNQNFDSQEAAETFIQSVKNAGYSGLIFPAYINGAYLVRMDDFSSTETAAAKAGEYQAFTSGVGLSAVGKEAKTFTFLDMNTKTILFEFEPKNGYPSIRSTGGGRSLAAESPRYLQENQPASGTPTFTPDDGLGGENPPAGEEPIPPVEGEVLPPPVDDVVPPVETPIPPSTENPMPMAVTEQPPYIKNGNYYYSGGFEFRRTGDNNFSVINFVPVDEYVKSVISFEMTNTWHVEALKAQAVCARTYAMTNVSRHKSDGFYICNGQHCQAYYGNSRENENVRQAAYATSGQVVTYNGGMIATYYFSSSGGYTESNANAWGGSPRPYYAAVPDLHEPQDKITHFSNFYTLAELTAIVQGFGADIGNVTDCYVSQYTEPAHNAYAVTFVGTKGEYTVQETDRVRIKLSKLVKSPRFDIYVVPILLVNDRVTSLDLPIAEMYALNGTGTAQKLPTKASDVTVRTAAGTYNIDTSNLVYNFKGSGWGHNVGMSQWGAYGMAEGGFTYDQILKHYFTGVEITTLS